MKRWKHVSIESDVSASIIFDDSIFKIPTKTMSRLNQADEAYASEEDEDYVPSEAESEKDDEEYDRDEDEFAGESAVRDQKTEV